MITEIKEKYEELAERKRAELEASIEDGEISDPFSGTILVSLAISAALSTASYFVSRALAPKPPRLQQGKLTGSLQLQNSEQGIFIPEIYGASPTISLTAGSSPTYTNTANVATAAGGSITKNAGGEAWNAGGSHSTSITSGDAFYEFTVGTGYATAGFANTASPRSGNTDFYFAAQWNPDGSVTIKYSGTQLVANVTHWVTGDRFRVEIREGRFRLYKGSAEIRPANFVAPTPTYPCYAGIAIQTVGAGISESKVQIGSIGSTPNAGRGGIKVPAIIVYSSKIRKNVSVTQQPTGGGKGGPKTQSVENITYDIDLGLMFGKGPNALLRLYANADVLIDQVTTSLLPTGVHDPTLPDDPYDPTLPPDPGLNYTRPILRQDEAVAFDADNVGTGTIQSGGALFAIYQGNETQDPDPTIEADINAQFGTGSTPAYRGKTLAVLKQLLLTRWGGIVPNFTAVWEHTTLKTFGPIFGALCERVGVLAANSDYSFTNLTGACRGLLIAGRPFKPAEIIGSPEIQLAGNFFVTEAEGQIIGYAEGGEPTVTIADTEIGWLDNESDDPEIIPEVDTVLASEISLNRQVDVKFIDPDNDWDANTQSAKRQITEGSAVELVEVQLCLLADEARAMAQRKLYRDYVAGTAHKFTLSWKYLYLYPGYKVTITRAEGFSHVLRLTSITGGLGVLECEGIALEPTVFTQPAPSTIPGNDPNNPVPAMTILMLLDIPLIRDGDDTNNYGIGQYVIGVPRTGLNQSWRGFGLYVLRHNSWTPIATSEVAGTVGTVVSTSGFTTDHTVIDRVGTITVDLYGTTAALTSVVELDMLNGANMALIGDLVFHFMTATQVPDFPNRWTLSGLLKGIRGTENHITDTFTGARFALLNEAAQFVPMEIADINQSLSYRGVTSGQSLDDAAIVTHVWTGMPLKPLAPVNLRGLRNDALDLLIEWTRRTRVSPNLKDYTGASLAEEEELYVVEIYSGTTLKRSVRVPIQPVPIVWQALNSLASISGNTLTHTTAVSGLGAEAKAYPQFTGLNATFEAIMQSANATNSGGFVYFLTEGLGKVGYNVRWGQGGSGNQLTIYEVERTVNSQSESLKVTATYTSGDRIRVQLTQNGFVFFKNPFGQAPSALYRSTVRFDSSTKFTISALITYLSPTAPGILAECMLLMSTPSYLYTAGQQTEDFGSTQSSIKVRVYQESAIVGKGSYIEGTI